jgi:hypothetical protein
LAKFSFAAMELYNKSDRMYGTNAEIRTYKMDVPCIGPFIFFDRPDFIVPNKIKMFLIS